MILSFMDIRKAYKYRIYPSKSQQRAIDYHIELCRQIYNWGINNRIRFYVGFGESLHRYDQQKQLTHFKKEVPEYQEVYSECLIDALIRVEKAYDNFFRRVKQGTEKPGFPHLKRIIDYHSMTRQCRIGANRKTFLPSQNSFIFTRTIGELKGVYHRPIPPSAVLKTATITKENSKYFISFSTIDTITDPIKKSKKRKSVKITLLAGQEPLLLKDSKGGEVYKPKYILDKEQDVKRIQRRFSKKAETEEQRAKEVKKLNKIFFRLKRRRQDFVWNLAKQYREYGKITIRVPDLAKLVQKQKEEENKITLDATLNAFVLALQSKSKMYNSEIEVIKY